MKRSQGELCVSSELKKTSPDSEVTEWIAAVGRMSEAVKRGFLNGREVEKIKKIAVFQLTFLPILTYTSESWTLTKKFQWRIKALEMRFLRKIEEKTRRDKVWNTNIRSNLNVKPANNVIEENRLRWLNHLLQWNQTELLVRSTKSK